MYPARKKRLQMQMQTGLCGTILRARWSTNNQSIYIQHILHFCMFLVPTCRKKKARSYLEENGCRSRKIVTQKICRGACHDGSCCKVCFLELPNSIHRHKHSFICSRKRWKRNGLEWFAKMGQGVLIYNDQMIYFYDEMHFLFRYIKTFDIVKNCACAKASKCNSKRPKKHRMR